MKTDKIVITVKATVNAPVDKVWNCWTAPEHIVQWNFASDDWHCPWAKNDVREGEKFVWRMEARDGSFGFDFSGKFTKVKQNKMIEEILDDDRTVRISFAENGNITEVTEVFEAENQNPVELQKIGWQAILNNFKNYAENHHKFERLHFEIQIDAEPAQVYATMLDKKHWKDWVSVFNPTSYYEGSWEKGEKIFFLGTGPDGKTGGMSGLIEENIKNRFLSICYKGIMKEDKEITEGPEAEAWLGGHENYTFENQNGKTILKVDLDATHDFKTYFSESYPKALNRLKSICEQ